MKRFHLFLRSNERDINLFQGSFETIEAVEAALDPIPQSLIEETDGRLYETGEDGGLVLRRIYLRRVALDPRWRGMYNEPERKGKTYYVHPKETNYEWR